MDKILNDYLEKVDKYLKPMKVTDRMDIIKEIESDMAELREHGGLSANEIIDRLGEPKKLAQAYLGETITETKGMSFRKLGAMIAFYSMAGTGRHYYSSSYRDYINSPDSQWYFVSAVWLVKLLASFVGYGAHSVYWLSAGKLFCISGFDIDSFDYCGTCFCGNRMGLMAGNKGLYQSCQRRV